MRPLAHEANGEVPLLPAFSSLVPVFRVALRSVGLVAELQLIKVSLVVDRRVQVLVHARPHPVERSLFEGPRHPPVRPPNRLRPIVFLQDFLLERRHHVDARSSGFPRVRRGARSVGRPVPVLRQPFLPPSLHGLRPRPVFPQRQPVRRAEMDGSVEAFSGGHRYALKGYGRWSSPHRGSVGRGRTAAMLDGHSCPSHAASVTNRMLGGRRGMEEKRREVSKQVRVAADDRIPALIAQRPDASERTPGTDTWS